MRLYWQRTLAYYWSRMISILEGDVLYRGRVLALDGPGTLFEGLHPTVSYQPHRLQIKRFCQRVHPDHKVSLDGNGIQLVPTIFAVKCMWLVVPHWRPALSYQVRGGGLWCQTPPSRSLEMALGAGRASVLQTLVNPSSTGELAHRLMITSGAVSQQLDRLKQAGLVEAHRSGKRVYYQLTKRGEELISLFDRIV
jgi:DNA-binding transcriptional ArsR family regulator